MKLRNDTLRLEHPTVGQTAMLCRVSPSSLTKTRARKTVTTKVPTVMVDMPTPASAAAFEVFVRSYADEIMVIIDRITAPAAA